MTESGQQDGRDAIGEQILEDHRRLAEILREVAATTDLREILSHLKSLLPLLEEHHAAEEATDGLAVMISGSHPAHTANLQRILSEHEPLRARVSTVTAKVEECLQGVYGPLLVEVAELASELRDHESRESELLSDAILTDLGVGD